MKFIKKSMLAFLAVAVSATLVACGPKKSDDTAKDKTQKIEYITDLTKDNVEEVVIEYKEILSYYNDLKNNLKTLDDVSKNPDLERDAVTAKDSIKNGQTLLSNTKTKYKPLVDAKAVLLKMYDSSISMADNVVNDSKAYQKSLSEYNTLFEEFKSMMDKIRLDVKSVRGTAPTDENKDNQDTNDNNNNNSDNNSANSNSNDKNQNSDLDNNSSKNSDSNNSSDSNNDSDKNSNSNNNSNSNKNNSNNSSNNQSSSNNDNSSNKNDGSAGFIPSVSSLNNNIRSEIKSAGYSAGASYKQNGGSSDNLDQIAAQQFNDLEGDNPIQKNQLSEARAIFVNAFKNAYNASH